MCLPCIVCDWEGVLATLQLEHFGNLSEGQKDIGESHMGQACT